MAKVAAIVALAFVLGAGAKTIKFTWKDCGTASTHAHVKSIKTVPDPPVLGQKTSITASGTLDEQLTSGKYEVKVKAGPFTAVDHKDTVCGDTTFDMKVMGITLGTATVHGPKCPVAAGTLPLSIDLTMTDKIPAGIAGATVDMTATDQNGKALLCMTLDAKIVNLEGEEPALANWESQGELMDEAELSKPAIHDEMISELNAKASWVAGSNTIFAGATLADVKKLLGTLQNTDASSFLPYKAPEDLVDLPAEFDWRTDPRAANCPSLKEIRDQANCGSCWAFGSVEAMTDRICIASGGKDTTHLSAQDVTSCDHLGDMGCNGGVPSTAYTYYKNSGVVDGGNYGDKKGCYSYQMAPCAHHSVSTKYPNCTGEKPTPKCARKCVDNGASWSGSKKHGTGGYSVCKQGSNMSCPDAMMQEIYQHGPITGMFFVHQSFVAYKSGVYKAGGPIKDPMLGGHAIKIMGWGTENGAPYWLVANSWNEDWGDHGYFKIDKGHNQCQIENAMINGGPVAGMPKLSVDELIV